MVRARWNVVFDDLRHQIDSGELAPGDKVPTEHELAEKYGWSRATVRTALNRLEQNGLITAGAASMGRTVRTRDLVSFNLSRFELGAYSDDSVNQVDQWEADAHSDGWQTRQLVTDVNEYPATPEVARWLKCRPGTRLLRRRRLRYVSKPGVPEQLAMVADTWTPLDIADLTVNGIAPLRQTENVVLPGGIYRALGFRQVQFIDEVEVRMPTPEETRLFELQPGSPVGQHARTGVDVSGRRVRVLVSVFPGERQRLTYELSVPEHRPSKGADDADL